MNQYLVNQYFYRFLLPGFLFVLLSACGSVDTDLPVEFDRGSVSVRMLESAGLTEVRSLTSGQTATVIASVLDNDGAPIAGVPVNFETTLGGFDPSSGTVLTNAGGEAAIFFDSNASSSGSGFGGGSSSDSSTGAGFITATAALTDRLIQSEDFNFEIIESQGGLNTSLPDNDSFVLFIPDQIGSGFSATDNPRNPEVSLPSAIGAQVGVVVNMGTQANSPVADDTQANFVTEFGSIETECSTQSGSCGVNWTGTLPIAPDGRTAIVAHVEGIETFVDANGSGSFDDGDTFTDSPGEAFRDDDENGSYDIGEWFNDRNGNGQRDPADGLFSGPNCTHSSLCAASTRVDIFANVFLNMSNGNAQLQNLLRTDTGVAISRIQEGVPFSFELTDSNGNPLPVSTAVSFSSTNGLLSLSSLTIPSSDRPETITTTLTSDFIIGPGFLTIMTVTPVSNTQTILTIPVDD